MELKLLIEMKNIQEDKLEKEAKRLARVRKLEQGAANKQTEWEGIAPHLQGMP